MASPTIPTVLPPTETDIDTDDEDDDLSSSLPGVPAATPPPNPSSTNNIVPGPASPGPAPPNQAVASISSPANASSRTTSTSPPTSTNKNSSTVSTPGLPGNPPNKNGSGLSVGETAGIGVGIALAVILATLGIWFFFRVRRRKRSRERKSSLGSGSNDVENARKPEIRAYMAGVPELDNEKARWAHELSSPVVPQEVHGDREFAAELPGSAVHEIKSEKDQAEMVTYHEPSPVVVPSEKKSGARLFDDPPIDERDEPFDVEPRSDNKNKM